MEGIDGKELERMPKDLTKSVRMAKTMLDQATIPEPPVEEWKQCNLQDTRLSKVSAIFKDKDKLDTVIIPAAKYYAEQNLTPQEAGVINGKEMQKSNDEADAAIKHPAQGNIAEATNITQLHQRDVDDYLDYRKSTAAQHDFFVAQTGIQMKDMIPNSVFTKSLKRIDLVDFKNDREILINHWIHPEIRPHFDTFFRHFRNRVFNTVSKHFSIPDHPPLHYFESKDYCPDEMHDLKSGLVRPKYLAFICSQALHEDATMLKKKKIKC